MKSKVFVFLLIMALIFSLAPTAFAGTVSIPDANLNGALRGILGISGSDPLTSEQLATITGAVNLSGKSISKIDGIQYLTGAQSIDLSLNDISSVPREIESLTSLEGLDLSGNRITRLPSNIGGMSGLKSLDIRANRLDELPSALSKLTLQTFNCDYNFLDVGDGGSDLGVINSINAPTKEYKRQLLPVQNFSAYSPQSGTVILYWDEMSFIHFDNGAIGEIARFSVLDGSYGYIGEANYTQKSYEISGLDTTTEYTFYVSADYYVQGTKYSNSYTKLYKSVKIKAVPQNTPTMELSTTETPTVTPEPITPTPTPPPATEEQQIVTPTPQPAAQATLPPKESGSLGTVIYIIIVVLGAIFVFITVLIILRAIGQRRSRNTRTRRR